MVAIGVPEQRRVSGAGDKLFGMYGIFRSQRFRIFFGGDLLLLFHAEKNSGSGRSCCRLVIHQQSRNNNAG